MLAVKINRCLIWFWSANLFSNMKWRIFCLWIMASQHKKSTSCRANGCTQLYSLYAEKSVNNTWMQMWEMYRMHVESSSISADLLEKTLSSHSGWLEKPPTWGAIYGRVRAPNGRHDVICCYLIVIVFTLGRGKFYLNVCYLWPIWWPTWQFQVNMPTTGSMTSMSPDLTPRFDLQCHVTWLHVFGVQSTTYCFTSVPLFQLISI